MEEGWKEVYSTVKEYKAEMAKDLLANEGINAVVMNQKDTAYRAFGDFRLFVDKQDVAQALILLENLKEGESE
mgnify:CR=1 FL=1